MNFFSSSFFVNFCFYVVKVRTLWGGKADTLHSLIRLSSLKSGSRVNHRATAHLCPLVTAFTPCGFSPPDEKPTIRPHKGFTDAWRGGRRQERRQSRRGGGAFVRLEGQQCDPIILQERDEEQKDSKSLKTQRRHQSSATGSTLVHVASRGRCGLRGPRYHAASWEHKHAKGLQQTVGGVITDQQQTGITTT
ncbi:hypothetical protein EYF80_000661 [Liparis tanakae]|uniref:Uncharacterized protein n=1 Tax=Liparis tanakae TaxID=230148 RepID=A0A4Z2JHU8_9TELE|nr:hypothetical protein EYF80_000661 [Liparis tanakae]